MSDSQDMAPVYEAFANALFPLGAEEGFAALMSFMISYVRAVADVDLELASRMLIATNQQVRRMSLELVEPKGNA